MDKEDQNTIKTRQNNEFEVDEFEFNVNGVLDVNTKLPWTEEEELNLQKGVNRFDQNFERILESYLFEHGRTPKDLENKYHKLTGRLGGLDGFPWSKQEDFILKTCVRAYGVQDFQVFQHFLPNRSAAEMEKRFFNVLDPTLSHGMWSDLEENILYVAVQEYGPVFSSIARILPGRSPSEVEKHWKIMKEGSDEYFLQAERKRQELNVKQDSYYWENM